MDAHDPYARWDNHLREIRGNVDVEHAINGSDYVTPGESPPEALIDAYDSGIRSADEQIGRVLSLLNEKTTVAITGDHGEEFGRYGSFHSASLYSTMSQVPVIVRTPNLDAGRRGETWAQHLDLGPTLLFASDIAVPESWEGEPLQLVSHDLDEPVYFTVEDNTVGVRRGDWKLIRLEDGSMELYQVPHGGSESGLAESDEVESELQELLEEFDNYRQTSLIGGTGESIKDRDEISSEVEESLENLGYLE